MERYNVILSLEARADVREIVRYIAKELREPSTAEHMLGCIEETIGSLESMPEKYALVSDEYLAACGIRMVAVKKYLIFYTVDHSKNEVNISRVLYGKRNWIDLLTVKRKPGSKRIGVAKGEFAVPDDFSEWSVMDEPEGVPATSSRMAVSGEHKGSHCDLEIEVNTCEFERVPKLGREALSGLLTIC